MKILGNVDYVIFPFILRDRFWLVWMTNLRKFFFGKCIIFGVNIFGMKIVQCKSVLHNYSSFFYLQ